MINARLCITFDLKDDDERRIGDARTVIAEIHDAMVKSGASVDTEIETLKDALNILNDILHGETF